MSPFLFFAEFLEKGNFLCYYFLYRKGEISLMKKRYGLKDMFIDAYKETRRSSILVYLILRGLVLLCMVMQLLHGDLSNAFLCLLSLVLLIIPSFIQHKFNITLPNTLEIIIYLFIFSAEILGEINNFYKAIPYWDTILHTLNGFLCAAVGFSLIHLLNKQSEKFKLSPMYLCIVAFCFSMTIGVLWEFFEFGADQLFLSDMQKDRVVSQISTVMLDPEENNNAVVIKGIEKTVLFDGDGNELAVIENGYLDIGIIDTMKDLFVNFIGAVVFSGIGFVYLKTNRNEKFISNFVPTKGKRPIPKTVSEKMQAHRKK